MANNSTKKSMKNTTKKKRNYFFFHFVKITGSPAALWMRPKVYSMGNTRPKDVKGGAMIVANHTSFFDPIFGFIVFWRRKMHCVASKDLYNTKFKNFFFTKVGCIQVDKNNFSMNCFHEVKEVLDDNKIVMIFPEGQLNLEQEEMLGFKSGAILMAHRANKPIIPMYIIKGKKWYNRWVAVMGDPIDVRALCGPIPTIASMEKASEFLRETENKLKNYYLQGEYEKK